jgi:predicted nucleic acid-binding protein
LILTDTSVWVDHLRKGDHRLAGLLEDSRVLTHPFIVGELALGNLANRRNVLGLLQNLPRVNVASDREVMQLIEYRHLAGRGIGWVDAHLLAALLLSEPAGFLTRDRKLAGLADELRIAVSLS